MKNYRNYRLGFLENFLRSFVIRWSNKNRDDGVSTTKAFQIFLSAFAISKVYLHFPYAKVRTPRIYQKTCETLQGLRIKKYIGDHSHIPSI